MQNNQNKESWKLQLINIFGLQSYIENKIVFNPPEAGYALVDNVKKQSIEFQPIIKKTRFKLKEFSHMKFRIFLIKEYCCAQIISVIPIIHICCNSGLVIIFSHGNSSDLGDVFQFGFKICELYKIDVILYDYTGYGFSKQTHKPSELGISRDLENILSYAQNKYNRIFLWGFSLGSAPTVDVGSRYQVSGIILQAPLASIGRVIDNRKSFQSKYDTFRNESKISNVSCPLFIFHGTDDQLIRISHSELLIQKCTQPHTFVPIQGAGHNDLSFYAEQPYTELSNKLREFFSLNKLEIEINIKLQDRFRNLIIEDKLNHLNYESTLQDIGSKNSKLQEEDDEPQTCHFFCQKKLF